MTTTPPPPPRRPRRTAATLRRLLLDAAAIEFEANGFAGATTAAITRRADVTEAQLFRLFDSKEALFRAAIFEPISRHFETFMAKSGTGVGTVSSRDEIAGQYTGELHDFLGRHSRMLMSLIVASSHGGRSASGLEDVNGIAAYFDRGAALMASRLGDGTHDDAAVAVRIAFAAVLGTVVFGSWLFPSDLIPQDQIRSSLTDFILRGTRA